MLPDLWYERTVEELTVEQQDNQEMQILGERILWLIEQRINFRLSHPKEYQRSLDFTSIESTQILVEKLAFSFGKSSISLVKVLIAIHYLKSGYDLVECLLLRAFGLVNVSEVEDLVRQKDCGNLLKTSELEEPTCVLKRSYVQRGGRGGGRERGKGRGHIRGHGDNHGYGYGYGRGSGGGGGGGGGGSGRQEKLVKHPSTDLQKPLRPKELPANFKLEMNNSDYKEALSNVIQQLTDLAKPAFQTSKHFLGNTGQFRYMTTVVSTDKQFKWSASAFSLDMEISEQMAAKNLLESITGYKFA